jgi:hypothetical protein
MGLLVGFQDSTPPSHIISPRDFVDIRWVKLCEWIVGEEYDRFFPGYARPTINVILLFFKMLMIVLITLV